MCFPNSLILSVLCFHTLTNCFFRNPFVLIFIRIARGCHPLAFLTLRTFLPPQAPTPLSTGSCSLFALSFRLRSFIFNHLQPLFPKHPGGGISAIALRSRRYRLPSFSFLLCFHTLTNPFSCNSFLFTSIQNPRGATLQRSRFSDLQTVQIRHRRSLGLCSVYTQSDSFLPRRRADISNRTAVKRRGGFA